ncbi:MAG: cyclase [Thermomicrobiales bacterium]
MALLAVQHTVRDYQTWRTVYDTLDEAQQDWGVTMATVHQLAGTPNTVLVLRHFATVAQARGFLTSREFEAAMQRAGVQGNPRVEIYA